MNEVIASGTGYEIADVYTAFKDAADNPCNAYFASTSDMNLDFHPNAYGHELIAEVINGLLAEIGGSGGEEQPEPQVEQLWVNGANVLEASNYTVACGSGTANRISDICAAGFPFRSLRSWTLTRVCSESSSSPVYRRSRT